MAGKEETEYTIKLKDEQVSAIGIATGQAVAEAFAGADADSRGRTQQVRDWRDTTLIQGAAALGQLGDPFASGTQVFREAFGATARGVGGKIGAAAGAAMGIDPITAHQIGEIIGQSVANSITREAAHTEQSARGAVSGIGLSLARQGVDRDTIKQIMGELLPVAAMVGKREAETLTDLASLSDRRFGISAADMGNLPTRILEKMQNVWEAQMGDTAATKARAVAQAVANER